MEPVITSEIVVAYSQCPRKAYLLLFSPDKGEPHEYVQILEQQRCANQERYLNGLQQTHADVQPYSLENLCKGSKVLINAQLQVDGFAADCGVLTRVEGTSTFGKYSYEPTIFVGTHGISKEQQLELSFVGYVLEQLQHTSPAAGRIEFIPLSFWYDAPLRSRDSDRRHDHGWFTVHRAAVPPDRVPGFHEPDARRVSAAGPAL